MARHANFRRGPRRQPEQPREVMGGAVAHFVRELDPRPNTPRVRVLEVADTAPIPVHPLSVTIAGRWSKRELVAALAEIADAIDGHNLLINERARAPGRQGL